MLKQNGIATNIKAFRKSLDKTQQEIAEVAGIQTTQLSTYETGQRTPNIDTLARIAKALNKSLDELYYGENAQTQAGPSLTRGQDIVACIRSLFEHGTIGRVVKNAEGTGRFGHTERFNCLVLRENLDEIDALVTYLDSFQYSRHTFTNPENHLNEECESIARRIDDSQDYCPF